MIQTGIWDLMVSEEAGLKIMSYKIISKYTIAGLLHFLNNTTKTEKAICMFKMTLNIFT